MIYIMLLLPTLLDVYTTRVTLFAKPIHVLHFNCILVLHFCLVYTLNYFRQRKTPDLRGFFEPIKYSCQLLTTHQRMLKGSFL